ncbi:hypothetical protein H6F43_00365 [Leptolyngbya sp. FACHB-36]|uniref:hypothetical protein n=1 Tax=Leptolyngbya sp. FACHB-36 TaxID=2692808 RepID=UPI001680A5B4|nr:hypothetical protein [Leptolyngbya sp. FACHB-36]MBD2018637.1 hypothetical protein [Leptolyngbya sp. FACHB-36]
MRQRKLVLPLLVLLGAAFFSAYSDLETNFLLKSAVILPVQVGACAWLLYAYWKGRLKETSGTKTGRSSSKS